MKVYVVCGGCPGDHHIIAVCKTAEMASDRAYSENRRCPGLDAYFEEWAVEGGGDGDGDLEGSV